MSRQVVVKTVYSGSFLVIAIDNVNTIKQEEWMREFTSFESGHKVQFFVERSKQAEETFNEWANS